MWGFQDLPQTYKQCKPSCSTSIHAEWMDGCITFIRIRIKIQLHVRQGD